jgi:hydroxyacylglutathione hydrolase
VTPAVERLELGPIGTNCYVVCAGADAAEAVVVDPSGPAEEIALRLAARGARCAAILVTHGHWDHLLGVADLAETTGAPVHMPEVERVLLEDASAFTPPSVPIRSWAPEIGVVGGDELTLAGITFRVLDVPGHSPGHVAYLADGCVFSGDVLFAGSVGRTDFPGSDWGTLVRSIGHLLDVAPPETLVYPGHGPETTLAAELESNPFLDEVRRDRRAQA